jgi:hypothetical protein
LLGIGQAGSVPSGCSIRSISTRLDPGGTTSLPSQPKL